MLLNRKISFIIILAVLGVIIAGAVSLWPKESPKPEPETPHPFYQIIDIETAQTLMYVPVKVTVGDELVSEENKRYQIVRIEENRAYARFVEYINIKEYAPNPGQPKDGGSR